jgi:hypothetical protein
LFHISSFYGFVIEVFLWISLPNIV